MSVPRFHIATRLVAGEVVTLATEQAKQLRKVLRQQIGAQVVLFDGSGAEAMACVISLEANVATCLVEELCWPQREPACCLTVGLALIRPANFELAAQKLTELGVARIVPLAAERSVVSYPDARDWAGRAARLQRIAREAAEQSERVTLPEIVQPQDLRSFLDAQPVIALVERSAALLLAAREPADAVVLAIGPEGGWSPTERAWIEAHAAATASLGNLILRAETAAIAAATLVLHRS